MVVRVISRTSGPLDCLRGLGHFLTSPETLSMTVSRASQARAIVDPRRDSRQAADSERDDASSYAVLGQLLLKAREQGWRSESRSER